ncbi:MAG: restriction endonuclease subunit S [Planctomycetaceae bacterium]|jgi:type I restriction enzyme S subunit|nr:restriction endonuclease subunit S [Planctomycetaceae bacterium]
MFIPKHIKQNGSKLIDNLPSGWKYVKLGNTSITIIDGDRGKNYPKQTEFTNVGFCLFLNAGNVTNEGFNFTTQAFISEQRDNLLRNGKLQRQDVVLTTRGTLGNVAYFDSKVQQEHIRINSGMVILRADEKNVSSHYLYTLLQSPVFYNQIETFITGSAQPQLPIQILNQFSIPLPPIREQQRIAAVLSLWDEAILQTRKLIDACKRRKKGFMQKLLTGKWRFPEFRNNKDDWKYVKLGDVAETYSGGTPSRTNKAFFNGTIPWIKSGELNQTNIYATEEHITEEALQQSAAKYVEANTLLYALYGATAGIPAITRIEATINQAILAIIPSKSLDSVFLFYWLQSNKEKYLSEFLQGGQPNLSGEIVKEYFIPLPPFQEQRKIASLLSLLDEEIHNWEQQFEKLKLQKMGLMQKLLTGQIRV